jgi:hypothetical protein
MHVSGSQWGFTLGETWIKPKEGPHKYKVLTDEYVLTHLPRYKAQGPAGDRYEHYQCLPKSLVSKYLQAVLIDDDDRLSDDFRNAFRSGLLHAGDKCKLDGKGRQAARPIVCGLKLRALAGRCAAFQMRDDIALKLAGVRSVMGMESGIEIAYHTVDCMLRHMIQQADCDDDLGDWPVAVQMDFENGYNNCSREKMCSNVQKWFPELTAYTRLMGHDRISDRMMFCTRIDSSARPGLASMLA